ncbi:hypothetical protein [Dyella sp.]|uniref:hypothetical protein n=1 Tax=Dyella sp. TaxID=1869338 RepID=UPI002D7A11E6|nr:hypothetical protein [Dyella sp.]HET6431650.1 hypothetical protein [Dyella sp.]
MQRTMRAGLVALLVITAWMSPPLRSDTATLSSGGFAESLVGSEQAAHGRLFIALFDCSWKHARGGPAGPTTVAWIHQQLSQGSLPAGTATGYVTTDCARDNWLTAKDHGEQFAGTRLAAMYKQLAAQFAAWRRQDPAARISLLIVGGSWGGLQGAEFAVMVDVLGLRSATGEVLVPPHRTEQALALLAPTGYLPPELRLPSSVISGFQLSATDEGS